MVDNTNKPPRIVRLIDEAMTSASKPVLLPPSFNTQQLDSFISAVESSIEEHNEDHGGNEGDKFDDFIQQTGRGLFLKKLKLLRANLTNAANIVQMTEIEGAFDSAFSEFLQTIDDAIDGKITDEIALKIKAGDDKNSGIVPTQNEREDYKKMWVDNTWQFRSKGRQ